jgi:hypothetical protein
MPPNKNIIKLWNRGDLSEVMRQQYNMTIAHLIIMSHYFEVDTFFHKYFKY